MTKAEKKREKILETYVNRKTRDLIEFGYTNLTREEVRAQLEKVLAKDANLDVIGIIIKSDFENAGKL